MVCPFCGPRELSEFEFLKTAPASGDNAYHRVYLRVDDGRLSVEHWQHSHGCRAWLLVRRNPSTGAVLSIEMLGSESS